MSYSRQELLAWKTMPKERYKEITTDLLQKLVNKEKLTLAESKFICLKTRTIFKAEDDIVAFKDSDYSQCNDFIFWDKYLLYWNDVEGWGRIKNGRETFVSDKQKIDDVKFLNNHYLQWKSLIEAGKFKNSILQTVASETVRLTQEITNESKSKGEGSNRQRYIEKTLILHSKYLYYQVSEYYEENASEETLNLCGQLIVIDHFVYIHTLFGHFAATVKFNRLGKTYHTTENVDFRNIPKNLLNILEAYENGIDCNHFNSQVIYLNLKGTDYAIWFRPMIRSLKNIGQQSYLRVQTYYPVELPDDLKRIKQLTLFKVDDQLSFYI